MALSKIEPDHVAPGQNSYWPLALPGGCNQPPQATAFVRDALGPIEGPNAARWTLEGPTFPVPGEPANSTVKLEVAHSLTATPGSDWREFRPGLYKLRSYRVRLTITRPTLDFDFRVYRLATRATRRAQPQAQAVSERFFAHG